MRRVAAAIAVLGCLVAAATVTAGTAASSSPVVLRLAHATYRAGQTIEVTVVNRSGSLLLRSLCLTLQRNTGGRWVTIAHTHGVAVGCPAIAGASQSPHSRSQVGLPLWDDLVPGHYEITLRYKRANTGPNLGSLRGPHVRSVTARLTVLAFRPAPKPHLSRNRILALARRAATDAGDATPTLIQHVEATRFDAVRVSSGDLVYAWNWSYLIAERGHFVFTNASGPPGAPPPKGTVLTLVVDAATGNITDDGLDNHYPPLAELGPVTTDLRAAH